MSTPPLQSVKLSSDEPPPAAVLPLRPRNVAETGLSVSYIADMVVRALYLVGEMTGQQLVEMLHLPYEGVIDQAMAYLRREQMVEVKGAGSVSERSYRFQISSRGVERAKERLVAEREEVRIQRDDAVGLVEVIDGVRRRAGRLAGGGAGGVARDRIPLVPFRLRERLLDQRDLLGDRR